MKILHLFRTGGQSYGLERNLLCSLPGLIDRGLDVVAVAVEEPSSGPMRPELVDQFAAAKIRLIRTQVSGRLPIAHTKGLRMLCEHERPDIVHTHGYKTDMTLVLSRAKVRRISTVHGWCSRNFKERFYEWIGVQACKRFDRVIVFCEDYRKRLLVRGVPDRLIRVVPVGLDTRVVPSGNIDFRLRWGIPRDAVVAAQIGRLSSEKRPDIFVRIAKHLAPRLPNAWFVLIGDGPMAEALRYKVRSTRTERVVFAGFIHEMTDAIKSIDIAVNCSSTEAMPRTVMEAGLAGVPMVATAVGGVPEMILDGVSGVLCDPDNVEAIESSIEKLVLNRSALREMGQAAAKHISETFSVDACTEKLIRVYEELLDNGSGLAETHG